MLIPPKYRLTEEVTKFLQEIEAAKSVIEAVPIPKEVELNIARQTLLKSSLFSARIEGNPLNLDEISDRPSEDKKKREVYNILQAMQSIDRQSNRAISLPYILKLHKLVMSGISYQAGKFRTEVSAIFTPAGVATYMPPPPGHIASLMEQLVTWINSGKEQFVPIRAVLAHYSFEKIHPFLDGNGRVGRLLTQTILQKSGHGMKGLVSLEEYLNRYKTEYYQGLTLPDTDVTEYLEFMLEMLSEASREVKQIVLTKKNVTKEDFLLPRRAEIFRIIRDHKLVTFDFIHRRFLRVNPRTLRYDLKKLQDGGFIRKLGTTKGVHYESIA